MGIGGRVAVAVAISVAAAGPATAATVVDPLREASAALPVLCTPTDTALKQLSGLAWSGDTGYAIGDHGSDDRLAVLDSGCRVSSWIDIDFPTTDVEDLALDSAGTVWLADTGDNDLARDSAALIGVDPSTGQQTQLPLAFSDGAHNIEAFLLTETGKPVLVTKVDGVAATVYTTPDGETVHTMSTDRATPLVAVGTVQTRGHDEKVRPITGAALSVDGTTAALRTKKDVFLYRVEDGDVVAALTGVPAVVLDAPDQPQGEALAFTDAGGLLLASEASGKPMPPVYELEGAVDLAHTADGQRTTVHLPVPVLVAGVGVALGAVAGVWWIRRRTRGAAAT